MTVRIKRVYDAPAPDDGMRILVDRLWPRGLKKDKAAIDRWMKDLAPSADLRRWFGHAPDRWPEFRRRYGEELAARPGALDALRRLAAAGPLTLVFAARDETRNNAAVLRDLLAGA